jgi:murein DD-endopeptidase MepM/ murein hydrolase activator NlpD
VGNSGLSFAPHLHFEVHLDGKPVEPVNYFFADLSPSEYREMLMIAINTGQSLD